MADTTEQPHVAAPRRPGDRKSLASEERRRDRSCNDGARQDEEQLFRRYHARLVGLVQGRLGVSRELAEDACSLAWIQFLRKQPSRDHIVGWLYTVAKHEAFSLLRRSRREPPGEELTGVPSAIDVDDILEARDSLRLIACLKPQQRKVLQLRAEGHSYRAICALTGHTYTWVNRHISEGRRALRQLIEGR